MVSIIQCTFLVSLPCGFCSFVGHPFPQTNIVLVIFLGGGK